MSSPPRKKRAADQGQQQQQPENNKKKNRRVSGSDAFAILMSSSSKQSSSSSSKRKNNNKSRFVLCPAGCGKHILENKINIHLDQCIVSSSPTEDQQQDQKKTEKVNTDASVSVRPYIPADMALDPSPTKQKLQMQQEDSEDPQSKTDKGETLKPAAVTAAAATDASAAKDEQHASNEGTKQLVTPDSPNKRVAVAATSTPTASSNNVFDLMMQQSKTVFSKPKKNMSTNAPLYFCLHSTNGRVSLGPYPPMDLNMTWSTKAGVRDPTSGVVPVILGTCIAPSSAGAAPVSPPNSRRRLVRYHSRLSVPVLKSMLQKCIRRRRPMPAVRIAMELADKSLVDLLRRLPIIVLEDSTLHPDFPFLVWLMMACSSSSRSSSDGELYTLPPVLLQRVMHIVYEVASCQWIDALHESALDAVDDVDSSSNKHLSLATILNDRDSSDASSSSADESSLDSHSNGSLLLVWSMLARASYGGMKCDTRMLKGYAHQWKGRFTLDTATAAAQRQSKDEIDKSSKAVPATETDATKAGATTSFPASWTNLPVFIHERARQQSRERVAPLFSNNLNQGQQQHDPAASSSFCLDRLRLEDTCLQGVDYHCCFGIMDHLLSDLELVNLSLDLLSLSSTSSTAGGGNEKDSLLPEDPKERRLHLAEIWKSCMWRYSSGVNHRLPLSKLLYQNDSSSHLKLLEDVVVEAPGATQAEKQVQVDPHAELWNGLAAPKVLSFQRKYVQQRLA